MPYLNSEKFKIERSNIKPVVYDQVEFLKSLYYYLDWERKYRELDY